KIHTTNERMPIKSLNLLASQGVRNNQNSCATIEMI
ncbi:hypothetical protein BER47_001370, partial [Staphylococcus aureus]